MQDEDGNKKSTASCKEKGQECLITAIEDI